MNHIHVADQETNGKKFNAYNCQENIHQFLRDNFPNDPRPVGPMRQGWVRVVPGDPTFQPSKWQPTDQSGCVQAWAWGSHTFVGQWDSVNREPDPKDRRGRETDPLQATVVQNSDIPLTANVFGDSTTREIQINEYDGKSRAYVMTTKTDTYDEDETPVPFAYLNVRFKFTGEVADVESVLGIFKFRQPTYGVAVLDPEGSGEVTVTSKFHGMTRTWTENLKFTVETHKVQRNRWDPSFTYEQFIQYWQKPCTYCTGAIETIGLDRVDNAQGYHMTNVTPCCHACNWMKGEGSLDDFLDRCKRIARNHAC